MHAHLELLGAFRASAPPPVDPYAPAGAPAPLACDPRLAWGALTAAAVAFSAYHGVRRNRGSVVYGLAWGLGAAVAPVVVPIVAVAQGYAEAADDGENDGD
jgi:hypothetical protein